MLKVCRPAVQAADPVEGAVELHHPLASRLLVEAVHVLGYDPGQTPVRLEAGEGAVGVVGHGARDPLPPDGAPGPVPPPPRRGADELPVLHGLAMAERAVGTPVVGDSRLGAAAGAHQGHHPTTPEEVHERRSGRDRERGAGHRHQRALYPRESRWTKGPWAAFRR